MVLSRIIRDVPIEAAWGVKPPPNIVKFAKKLIKKSAMVEFRYTYTGHNNEQKGIYMFVTISFQATRSDKAFTMLFYTKCGVPKPFLQS